MGNRMSHETETHFLQKKRNKIWTKIVIGMACLVVFITTYALILPAITMDNPVCGMEEHVHTDACYTEVSEVTAVRCSLESLGVHVHTEDCYDAEENLVCGYADYVIHTHGESCYDSQGNLLCSLPEIKEGDNLENGSQKWVAEVHKHIEDCYDAEGNLICGKLETQEHVHDDSCLEIAYENILVCEVPEHTHTDACYPEETSDQNGISLFSDNTVEETLPVTSISGSGTEYDPQEDVFNVDIRIEFLFENAGAISAEKVYTYTYPEGTIIPEEELNIEQKLYDNGNIYAGTYTFVKNADGTYSVQIAFNQSYLDTIGESVSGYVQFEGTIGKENMKENGDLVVGSDNNILTIPAKDITYPADETESYNIDVSKSGTWVRDGDSLVYTVYVRTTKGTPDPIDFSDTITIPDGITLGDPVVTVERGTAHYYGTWYGDDNNWTTVEVSSTYENGTLHMSLDQLTASEKTDQNGTNYIEGDVYKITYTYAITDQTVSVSANNKVTVKSEDSTKGQIVTDIGESTVSVDKDFSYTVDKTGSYDPSTGKIKWTVTVNSNKVDIAGAVLTDAMLNHVANENDISIVPSEGYTKDGSIITFVATADGKNKNQYTITYYTSLEDSWDGQTVSNTAKLDPKPGESGDEVEATATVDTGKVTLGKTGTYNGETGKIDWVITINSGNKDIAGATLTDEMFAALSENDFSIDPGEGYEFIKDDNGNITGITFSGEKNTKSYTIRYSTTVSGANASAGTTVTNSATLSPGNGPGTPVGADADVTVDPVSLTKTGSYYDAKITWTITVNEKNHNIVGAVLTDPVFSQVKADEIEVKADWIAVDASTGHYIVHTNEDGTIKDITFQEVSDGKNTKMYQITYITSALPEWEKRYVDNTATLTMDGDVTANTKVEVPEGGELSKTVGEAVISQDCQTAEVPWTVTIKVPVGGMAAGTRIEESFITNGTKQYMTQEQVTAWAAKMTWEGKSYTPQDTDITFTGSDGGEYTLAAIKESTDGFFDDITFTGFVVTFPNGLKPGTDGGSDAGVLTFTYNTTADLSGADIGGNQYLNEVKVGNKSSTATYVYNKPGVVKYDGNGNTGTTVTSSDGTLVWQVNVSMDDQNNSYFEIEDALPGGVVLDSLVMNGSTSLDMTIAEEGTISGENGAYRISGTYNKETGKVSLRMEPVDTSGIIENGSNYTIIFTCHSEESLKDGSSHELTNSVSLKTDKGEIGSSTQTQEWTYQKSVEQVQVVDKSGSWDNTNRRMDYTLVLNPEGEKLLGEDVGDDATLKLIDTLTFSKYAYGTGTGTRYTVNAVLIQNSVKLYYGVQNTDGTWTVGEEVQGWRWVYSDDSDDWNGRHIITASDIPDGTPLILMYAYKVSSSAPNTEGVSFDLNFSNEAKLEGTAYSGSSSSEGTQWKHSSSSGGVTTEKTFSLYKVEAGNYNVTLSGAVFSVYAYDTGNDAYISDPVTSYTTDDKGTFLIERNAAGGYLYQYNTLYKVVETSPPKGYRLPDDVKEYYFYFSSQTDTEHTLPTNLPSDAVDLSENAYTVYAENVKDATDLTVVKKWQDKDGNEMTMNSGEVTVNLYRKEGEAASGGSGGSSDGKATLTITDNNDLDEYFADFTSSYPVGTTITYQITYKWWQYAQPECIATVNGTAIELSQSEGTETGYHNFTFSLVLDKDTTVVLTLGDNRNYNWFGTVLNVTNPPETEDSETNTDDTETTEDILVATAIIKASDQWTYTFTDLPKSGVSEDGTVVSYFYYVVETPVTNYTTSYDNNGGIQSGTITITNTASDNPAYTLPETGGHGTLPYIAGSLLTCGAGICLLYKSKKRRKEERVSS